MLSGYEEQPGAAPGDSSAERPDFEGCVTARVELTRDGRSWTEHINVLATLARVLGEHGHEVGSHDTWLAHAPTGLVIRPLFHQLAPLEDGGFRTVTTIAVSHPELVPQGVFEYQHGWGNSVEGSIRTGFDQWAQMDLVALLDALKPMPETCMMMEMSFPEREGSPARIRRVILSPVAHYPANPAAESRQAEPDDDGNHPPFCACCLFTRSFLAFKDMVEDDAFHGIRIYAARGADGAPEADCRVDGNDWEPGAQALREFVQTWEGTGFEFRKQYVVVTSAPRDDKAGP